MATENIQQRPEVPADSIVRDVELNLESILTKFPITQQIVVNGGQRAFQNRHEWFDDQITQKASVLDGDITAHAALAVGVTIPVADTTPFRVNDTVFVDLIQSVYLVTAITVGVSLTVTEIRNVALGSTTGNGSKITFTRGTLELSTYGSDFNGARVGTQVYNFTQIFRRDLQITRHEVQSVQMGGVYTQNDFWLNAQNRQLEQLAWDMYQAITLGVGIERSTTATLGKMGGVRQFIDVAGGNVVTASGALSGSLLNEAAEMVYDDMGVDMNVVFVMGVGMSQAVAALDSNLRRFNDPGQNNSQGYNIVTWVPDIGGVSAIPIIIDRNMPRNEIWLIDRNKLQLIPFGSETLQFIEAVTPGTTARQGYFYGEYTMVIRNGAQAHGIIKNITV